MNGESSFMRVMEGLVSNEVTKRTKSLNELNDLLVEIIKSNDKVSSEEQFKKIWKSLFYLFWNTDKPSNQKMTADDISFKLELFEKSDYLIPFMRIFLFEFCQKWAKIDFLRLDKYIMLLQTILKKFFEICLRNKYLKKILVFLNSSQKVIYSEIYNYSFSFNFNKCLPFLIDLIFDSDFLELEYLKELILKLIEIFLKSEDVRELESFKNNIFSKLIEKLSLNKTHLEIILPIIFDKASSKENFSENKRKILFKFYKFLKYKLQILNEEYNEKDDNSIDLGESLFNSNDQVKITEPSGYYICKALSKTLKKKMLFSLLRKKQSKPINLENTRVIKLDDTQEIIETEENKLDSNLELYSDEYFKETNEIISEDLKKNNKENVTKNDKIFNQENIDNKEITINKSNNGHIAKNSKKKKEKLDKKPELNQQNEISTLEVKKKFNFEEKAKQIAAMNSNDNSFISKKRKNSSPDTGKNNKINPKKLKKIPRKTVNFVNSQATINIYDNNRPIIHDSEISKIFSNDASVKGVLIKNKKKSLKFE